MARKDKGRRYFGSTRTLPSGRVQVRYTGPDGRSYTGRTPEGKPLTFDGMERAEAYLARVHADIQAGRWVSPDAPRPGAPKLLREYAAAWLPSRELGDLTREQYEGLLKDYILPVFGGVPLASITPAAVREWYTGLASQTGPTRRAHAYSLLRTIMNTAIADEEISANPCRVRGAGKSKRARKIRPASIPELEAIVAALPARYRLMALLAAWCAMRFGELAELRRADIDVKNGVIRVRRGVVRPRKAPGQRKVKDPKSEAGKRDVTIPPHLMPLVKAHMRDHVTADRTALLFPAATDPARQMAPSTLYAVFFPARELAGRPDLNFHDLRHTGATLAAVSGATLRELMSRLGHSTPAAAMIYQHAAADRDKVIAEALSKLAAGKVTPISQAKSARKRKDTA
jgi:integrase